jgi:hypothetical protein
MSANYLHTIIATYPGTCGWCGAMIYVGMDIASPGRGLRWQHAECVQAQRSAS